MQDNFHTRPFFLFLVKFLSLFLIFYYGTKFVISASSQNGTYYNAFIAKYLDYISWMRNLLLFGASNVAEIFGYKTQYEDPFLIRVAGGRGVFVAFSCIGYGVMSFWSAYVLANRWAFPFTLIWLIMGNILIVTINVFRIGLFLIAINNNLKFPFGIDHHTWFNIVAYVVIFAMIFLFEKKQFYK